MPAIPSGAEDHNKDNVSSEIAYPRTMLVNPAERQGHLELALQLTQIPTAAGREQRVVRWLTRWFQARPDLLLETDGAGNMAVSIRGAGGAKPPVCFTAHLDHPAFVVERMVAPTTLELSFRGGVMDDYFKDARVMLWPKTDDGTSEGIEEPIRGVLIGPSPTPGAYNKHYLCELDSPHDDITLGDVATWDVGPGAIEDGLIKTTVCDDLVALAAALCAFDRIRAMRAAGERTEDVRLLLTRAEEVGFIGAIAACRLGTIPAGSRLIALENSRSFADSPIGGGPIVRVGDRLSVFSPTLSASVAQRAEEIAGAPATPSAQQKADAAAHATPKWRWQRKLMAGGACEATVYCAYGHDATCVCLPLGNYHNMADLDAVQAGTNATPPRVDREFVSVADYHGLVDLLIACGERLPQAPSTMDRIDKLWTERQGVLGA
jgi:putative aminopeptidase FrvX